MTVLLTTLNSKYIHSNLALRYLREYVKDISDIRLEEYTINQNPAEIAAKIYEIKPKIVGFSTYIWNIDETLEICERLKLVLPETRILLGGPEVSFDMENLMKAHPFIDYVIYGEGEESFRELLKKGNPKDVNGIAFRKGAEVEVNPPRMLIKDINTIPSPYMEIGEEYRNKIVYYESSRGCPFNCTFCLSSTIKGVRFMDIERVKRDLDNLMDGGVRQVKFVDRTFNANKDFSREIMNHIIKRDPLDMNFHFEVTAHMIDDEQLKFYRDIKEGLFQFEIGVQSTNPETIEAIGRNTDFERLSEVSKKIKANRNIHQHLDLIAGLPFEDYRRFGVSFDQIYQLRPEKIQLGFLKLLKGSRLREKKDEYGYRLLDKAPYEVMETNWLSFEDIISLKRIEELVEKYYNEEYFKHSLEFTIISNFKSPFKFFEDFSQYWKSNELYDVSHSRDSLYGIFHDYFLQKSFPYYDMFVEIIRFDYLENNNGKQPPVFLSTGAESPRSNIHEILKQERLLLEYLPEYVSHPTKKVLKDVNIQEFKYNIFKIIDGGYNPEDNSSRTVILFKYGKGIIERCKSYDVTKYARELT